MKPEHEYGGPVIIFDGVCNLCNKTVDWVIRRDKKKTFRFTANQQEAGIEILGRHGVDPEEVSTIYLLDGGRLYKRSSAVLRITRRLGFPWNVGYGFMLVPRFIRDWVYKGVARKRYRWWGKKDTCRMPSQEERARFLDA